MSNKKEFQDKLKTLHLPSSTKVGVVLLHGLTGMPNEMRPIARAMERIGCLTETPMLPGHGATHKELLDSGWKDWVRGSREAVDKLSGECNQVFICGLSMGALIPVLIANDNPKVKGIVAMSPTVKYDSQNSSNPFQVLLPLIDLFPFLGRIFYWTEAPPYGLKDERLQRKITKELEAARNGEKTGFGQFRTYSGSLRQLQHLVWHVRRQAHRLQCPILIMHSKEDTLTTVYNPQTFYSWLGSSDKNIIYLEGCDHVLPLDLKKEEVAFYAAEFVCRVARANLSAEDNAAADATDAADAATINGHEEDDDDSADLAADVATAATHADAASALN